MESFDTDVLIVGAGPGGSAAAIRLAEQNVKVILVDKCEFPRAKVCGDGLTPKSVVALRELGIEPLSLSSARSFKQLTLVSPKGTSGTLTLTDVSVDGPGVVVQRRHLDNALVELAIRRGVSFMPGMRITKPVLRKGRVCGAEGEREGQTVQLRARLTIAADGAAGGFTARLSSRRRHTAGEVAMRTYFTNVTGLSGGLHIYFDRRLLPAYGWVFPLDDGMANIGVGLEGRALKRTNLSAAFHEFLKSQPNLRDHLHGAEMLEPPRGFPLRSDFDWRATFTSGVLCVGDAAGLVHPFTGEGIRYALESGMMAAKHAISALSHGDVSAKSMQLYAEELRRRYGRMHRMGNWMRSAFRWPRAANAVLSNWCTPESRVAE